MPPHPSDAPHAPSRERLLQAAKRLFAAQGYEQTATSAIAREAGTSESQLMRYFGGKTGVLDALFDEAWTALNARVQRVIDEPGDTRQTMLGVIETIATALSRDADLAALLLFEGRRLRGDGRRVRLSAGFVAFSEMAKGLVRRGQSAGELDQTLDPVALTSAILGAAEGLMRDRLIARQSKTRPFGEREIVRTLDAILAGVSGRAPRPSRPASSRRGRTRRGR